MEVIAQGVETEAQCKLLEALGCAACQGPLFSEALTLAELEEFLQPEPASALITGSSGSAA